MDKLIQNFFQASCHQEVSKVPLALIADSPWIPGFAGIDTLDYYLDQKKWFEININLRERFPEVVWVPGFWWEYGMAIEASAFGSRIIFHHDQPPSIEPISTDLQFWKNKTKVRDPEKDGLMPLALRQIERSDQELQSYGLGQHIASSRGILTVTSWFMGVTTLMESLLSAPDDIIPILEVVTDTIILWLEAQLKRMREPKGILLLDDLIGMISKRVYLRIVDPLFRKIWDHFDGYVKIYHNDTSCEHLYPVLAETGFDVFNFSDKTDIGTARQLMGKQIVLMGNVAPRDIGALGTPEQVYRAAWNCLEKTNGEGLILSFGGGISPGTPAENIDSMIKALNDWYKR